MAIIAVPILIQVYFNSSLVYGLMRLLRVHYAIAAPGALIGASNFFELAVATAITLFGPESGAALATLVGVLVEVPVILSVCALCNRTQDGFRLENERPNRIALCTRRTAATDGVSGRQPVPACLK